MTANISSEEGHQSARRGEPDGPAAPEAGQPEDAQDTGVTKETAAVEGIVELEESSVVAHAEPSDGRPWCIGYS